MESWKEFLREAEKVSIQMNPMYVGKWNDQAIAVNDADVLNIHNDARDFVLLLDKLAEHIGVPEPVITSGYRDAKRQTGPMLGIWVRNGGRADALMGLKGSNNRGSDYIINLYSECERRSACVRGAGELAERLVNIWEESVNPPEEQNAIPPEAFNATVDAITSNGGISMHQAGQSIDYGLSSNPVGAGHIKQLLDYISEFNLADMHVIDERVGVNADGEEKAGDHWHITVRNLTPMGVNFLKTSNYSIDARAQIDTSMSDRELNESVKTVVRIEEEEFVEDDGTMVRKIKMYDDTGELVAQPTFSHHHLDPRRKTESPHTSGGMV